MLEFNFEDSFYEILKDLSELRISRMVKKQMGNFFDPKIDKEFIVKYRKSAYHEWDMINYTELLLNNPIYAIPENRGYCDFYLSQLFFHNTEWLIKPDGYVWISDIKYLCDIYGYDFDEFKQRAAKLMRDNNYKDYSTITFDQLFNDLVEKKERNQLIKWRDKYAKK